jgi:hypothetical protein
MQSEETVVAALRSFRSQVFHFASFDERRFRDDHYHCVACWKTIAAPKRPDVEHEGYVTVHEVHYTGFPVMMQYAWVCSECFPRYRDSYDWKISTESIPEIPEGTRRAFDSAYQEYLRNLGPSK